MTRVVVNLSGGMDSTALLYRLKADGAECFALGVDYGQRHRRELLAARHIADVAGVRYEQVDLSGLRVLMTGSSQTDPTVAVPHGHYTEESMKLTVVPNRNMMLLGAAIAWAISLKAEAVAYAAHAGDHAIYPDCREEFVTALSQAAALADWHPVTILRPFIGMTKAQVAQEGARFGAPLHLTWSCYDPQGDDIQFSPRWVDGITLDWFAGFVEGEGSFTHQNNGASETQYARFSVTQKDRAILESIRKSLGFGSVSEQRGEPHNTWQFGTTGGNVCRKLAHLLEGRLRVPAKRAQFERWCSRFNLLDQRSAQHCGRCGTCVERREAFTLAGLPDPTVYRP